MKKKLIHLGDCFINSNNVIWTARDYSEFHKKYTLSSEIHGSMYINEEDIFHNFKRCDEHGVIINDGNRVEDENELETIDLLFKPKVKIELIKELTIRGTTTYSVAINGSVQVATITLDESEALAMYEKIKQNYLNAKKEVVKSEEI